MDSNCSENTSKVFGTDKQTEFRCWLFNKWMDYKQERFEWDNIIVTDPPSAYFQRYKWFLKHMFKEEMKSRDKD